VALELLSVTCCAHLSLALVLPVIPVKGSRTRKQRIPI
jgi:hypothetical protein